MIHPVSTDAWDGGAKVGAAFQGRAREFHSRLVTGSLKSLEQMRRLRTDVVRKSEARSVRPRPLRPEVLIDIERACQKVPMAGCLRRTVLRDKKTLSVGNVWLIPALQRAADWSAGEGELSVTMLFDTMEIDRHGEVNRIMRTLGVVSLHAVARWYARAFTTTDEALMVDLLLIASFAERGTQDHHGHEFSLATNNGGSWRGHLCPTGRSWGDDPEEVLQCRTFY